MNRRVVHERTASVVHDEPLIAAYASLGNLDPDAPPARFVREAGGAVYPGRFDARSLALVLVTGDGGSFVAASDEPRSMAADMVALGAGSVVATVGTVGVDGLPQVHTLFGRYATRATASKVCYASLPYVGDGDVLVGDPLMRRIAPAAQSEGGSRPSGSPCWMNVDEAQSGAASANEDNRPSSLPGG